MSFTIEDTVKSIILCVGVVGLFFLFVKEIDTSPKTFEDAYNKAYKQCLTEQQNNTKITNKEYYCVNYATAKVK